MQEPSTGSIGSSSRAAGVAVLSPSGWGNLGDAAIVDSVIHGVRRRLPGESIVGLTLNPADTVVRHGIPAYTCSGFSFGDYGVTEYQPWMVPGAAPEPQREIPHTNGSPWNLVRRLPFASKAFSVAHVVRADTRHRRLTAPLSKTLKYVVVAGGGQLDDFWGGSFGHPYVLWRWSRQAHSAHARFVVLSVGTGTLSTRISRWFVRQALAGSAYRSFRDEGSRRLVGVPWVTEDPIVPDLAYGFPVENYFAQAKTRAERPLLAVSPFAHCDPRVGPVRDEARYQSYIERLSAVAASLLEQGYDLVLYGTDGADAPCVEDLRAAITRRSSAASPERLRTPRVTTLRELYAALAGVQVVLASRLHGVILPHLAGIPVAALSYERKVSTLMKIMQHERFCAPIDEFDPAAACASVLELVRQHAAVSNEIRTRLAGFRAEVEAQYDAVFGAGGRT
jgi:polysaccharide pyruvyl transferase WcaK-like protein